MGPTRMTERAEPRWLTDDEQASWLALTSVLVRLSAALDAQLRRDAGMSNFEYQVLSALSEAPDRTLRMSGLASFTESSMPRVSHVVARLEEHGWVRRTPDPTDGRGTLAALTEDGWATVVATAPGHVAQVRALVLDPLDPALVRQLGEIHRRIMKAIDPDDDCFRRRPGRSDH